MDSYNNDQESYNLICEATGCFDRATNKIIVKAGAQKLISLLLCNGFVTKFQEST